MLGASESSQNSSGHKRIFITSRVEYERNKHKRVTVRLVTPWLGSAPGTSDFRKYTYT
jgi:hypothetical protein